MGEQLSAFGNYEDALRAYNWGPTSVAKYNAGELSYGMPEETEKYVPKIKGYIEVFSVYGF